MFRLFRRNGKQKLIFIAPILLPTASMKVFFLFSILSFRLFQITKGFSCTVGTGRNRIVRSTTLQMVSNYATNQQVQVLSGIRDVVDRYDTFLLDMWGVMHDGTTTYEGVLEVVSKLVAAGKEVKILSNSSKRQDNSIKMLKKLGFDPSNFSQIITSGEVAYHMLSATSPVANALAPQPWDALLESLSNNNNNNKKVFCFGSGSGDEEYFESCGWTLSTMEEADLIVARGTFTINDGENVIDKTRDGEEAYFQVYHEQIAKAAKRRIPMIVANPDKVRPDADRSPMPGTIGNAYEEALGDGSELLLKYIGKPFSDVYEIALRDQDRSRVCMVGDALETDITGAKLEGIDSIWVIKDGIHNVEIEEKGNGDLKVGCEHVLQEFNLMEDTYAKENVLFPTIVLSHFQW